MAQHTVLRHSEVAQVGAISGRPIRAGPTRKTRLLSPLRSGKPGTRPGAVPANRLTRRRTDSRVACFTGVDYFPNFAGSDWHSYIAHPMGPQRVHKPIHQHREGRRRATFATGFDAKRIGR